MKIIALIQGYYGERIVNWIKASCPIDWTIRSISLPKVSLREALDEKLPFRLPKLRGELILSLGEQKELNMLLPKVVEELRVEAVLVSIDDPEWSGGLGFENQIAEELGERGVEVAFARPLCSLKKSKSKAVNEFLKFYGEPELKIRVAGELISEVSVLRGAPCGSTWYVAKMIKGMNVKDVVVKAGLILQNYPCLASTRMDKLLGDAPIHFSAKIITDSIKRALNLKTLEAI